MNLRKKIVIVDYGVGNTYSVFNAIKRLGYSNIIISSESDLITNADFLILPGVGAFEACIENLYHFDLVDSLNYAVLKKKIPILGICVGMQLLADYSLENGSHQGLGWIPGCVLKMDLGENFTVPHVGWNDISFDTSDLMFRNLAVNPHFYFDHSYHFNCENKYISSFIQYNKKIIASVRRDNIFGVQFHPEKSHFNGLKLFRAFLEQS